MDYVVLPRNVNHLKPDLTLSEEKSEMAYTAEISRVNPSCFLFVIDQSGSMSDPFGGSDSGPSKAEQLATVINRSLHNLIIKCSKDND
jgi:hypothetical protein